MKFANFVLICIIRAGKCNTFGPKVILHNFATKLCNFTNFNMLFLVVVMDFVLLA